MSERYSAPAIDKTGFNCPHCGVLTVQRWSDTYRKDLDKGTTPSRAHGKKVDPGLQILQDLGDEILRGGVNQLQAGKVFCRTGSNSINGHRMFNLSVAQCDHCTELSIWIVDTMIYPGAVAIEPHRDLPENVRLTYIEASRIVDISPRASAALSRLAIQELCHFLGQTTGNLNDQIAGLVKSGLDPTVSQMLDAVKVIGNNAVHPGEIDIKDDTATARFLLNCINRICQRLITEKNEAQALFEMLPEGAKAAIERRDKLGLLRKPDAQDIQK